MNYPPDIDAAYDAWGANCGPCSLAALLERPVEDMRHLMAGIEARGYVNPMHMKAALDQAGMCYRSLGPKRPNHGLIFLQWGGHAHKPIPVQYRFTHWVALDGELVFEVNAPALVSWAEWVRVMPILIKEHGKGDGTFYIRSGLEIARQ